MFHEKPKLDESMKSAAVAFLSNIPLNLKDACPECKRSNEASHSNDNSQLILAHSEKKLLLDESHGDVVPKGKRLTIPLQRNLLHKRSISSTVEVKKGTQQKRQSSLTEVTVHVSGSGDGIEKLHAPVLKMKFMSEKTLHSNRCFSSSVHQGQSKTPKVPSLSRFVLHIFCATLLDDIERAAAGESAKNKAAIGVENIFSTSDGTNIAASNQVVSYQSLLDPSPPIQDVNLNCAEWMSGKHRTVLALNGYKVSVIGYTKPSELKRDLNQHFKSSFPSVNITLSKVRSLERHMHRVTKQFDIQMGVLPCAKTYFERLVFAGLVDKSNRQQVAAACLLLSAKIHADLKSDVVRQLVSSLEHSFKSAKSSFLSMEFSVFATLNFSLLPTAKRRHLSAD